MPSTSMGMKTSDSRVNVTPTTSAPSSSKVTANTAHGAKVSMPERNKPSGWVTFGGGGSRTGGDMRTEEYGKSGQQQKHPTPVFSIPRTMPKRK